MMSLEFLTLLSATTTLEVVDKFAYLESSIPSDFSMNREPRGFVGDAHNGMNGLAENPQ